MLSTRLVSNMSVRLSSCLLLFFALLPAISVGQTTLTVAAAADLAPLQPSLASSFRKKAPAISLRFVTESSASLAQQIENGAPYDLFLSANVLFVDRLVASGHLRAASVRVYTHGRLGLLWRSEAQPSIDHLADAAVRFVALPNPKLAPYGVAAEQALRHAGLWQQVQPKIVYGENVRQALQLLTSGNADAVLTSASLLQGRHAREIPESWHDPILQKAGIVSTTKNADAAEAFLELLTASAGQAVFAQFGFAPISR